MITNTSVVPVTITSIIDTFPGQPPISGLCAGTVIGQTLQPGDSATCNFLLSDYAPPAGTSITDTVEVVGCQVGLPANCATTPGTSTVNSPALVGRSGRAPETGSPAPSVGTAPDSAPAAAPAAPAAAPGGSLAFTGVPSRLQLLLEVGFSLLSAGMFILWLTRPRRPGTV